MAQFGNRMFAGRAVPGLLGGSPAERPGVYGNPGQFQPMPALPRPDLPAFGRGNELPGMGQPQLGGGLPVYQPQGGPVAERPGVYGVDPGANPFQPMPRGPLPDLPDGGRGNGLPGMAPLPGGVSGFAPGMQGIGTGVGGLNPMGMPDPNNIMRGGGTIGGYSSGPGGMSRPMAPPMPERPGVYGNPGQFQPMQRPRPVLPIGGRAPMRSF